jgi:hypothetical protein
MAAYEDPRWYEDGTVSASQRRDVPYYENTVGALIDGGATGTLDWASNGNRKAWGRKDADGDLYFELEATTATNVRVYHATETGDDTYTDVTVAAGGTYDELVPGVDITLESSITVGHKARVYPGSFLLDNSTMYCPIDQAGDWIRYVYINPGSSVAHKLCAARVIRGTWFDNLSGSAIDGFRSTIPNAIADTYAVTIANGTSSGKKVTFTGIHNTYIVDNVTPGTTGRAISTTGLTFDLAASVNNTDVAVCEVSDAADVVEICPDDDGSPDEANLVTWDDELGVYLPLSPAGASDQVNPAGGLIYYWMRANPGPSHGIGRGQALHYIDVQRAA